MSRRFDKFLYQKRNPSEKEYFFFLFISSPYLTEGYPLRSLLYSLKLLRTKRLPCPVISVGKHHGGRDRQDPLVMAIAKGLMEKGTSIAILSRGYKGTKTSEPIVSDGKDIFLSPEESGDEPFLMAKACQGIPVLIGKNRVLNGRIASSTI